MNCREAQAQVFAERDGALDPLQRAALDSHVAECATCRRIRDDLAAVFMTWRVEVEKVPVPEAEREWHAVRRRIRGGVEAGAERTSQPRRNLVPWLAVPLGAAAAAAVALFVTPQTPTAIRTSPPAAQVARADSVEAPGNNASTMVFVDDKSGWLIVWASDAKRG
jgi:hypothetical protein